MHLINFMIPIRIGNRKLYSLLFTVLCLLLMSHHVQATSNRLTNIEYFNLSGNRVQINLNFSETIFTPVSFTTDNPAKIILDFPSVTLDLKTKSQSVGVGAVQDISVVETNERTRIVISLVSMVSYYIDTANNRVSIEIDNISNKPTSTAVKSALALPQFQPKSAPVVTNYAARASIQAVDFRRTPNKAGRLVVSLSNPNIVVDMAEQGNDIVLNFKDTHLPKHLDRQLDVIDFATPVQLIDTSQKGGGVEMRISSIGSYEHLAYQSEEMYVVEIKEVIEAKQGEKKQKTPTFSGQKVSFNFQKIGVRAALMLLTDLPGVNLNLVASDNVQGEVSLRLKNVPWDQALDIILESSGLGMRKVGNVLMVDSKEKLAERERAELAAQQEIKKLEPVKTEFIRVNYHKAKDLVELLSNTGGSREGGSFLSNRGSVSHDERTNTLILQDTATRLAEIRSLIQELDEPSRQVLIESRIVIATDDFSKALGVRFGYSGNQDLGSGYGAVVGGKVGGTTTFREDTAFTSDNTAVGEGEGENFIVSLPETLGAGQRVGLGLAIGKIGSYLLQLELSALQQEGRGEIISSPRVITANGKEAKITQGQEIPYLPAAGVGAIAQVQFITAALELQVTPQITPDERIIMDLKVSKNEPGTASGGGQPPINKREVVTQVLVDNGETVVLGGVYEQTTSNSIERVPFFGDLPLIGNLFKRRSSSNRKAELLIFVTPKILEEVTSS